MDWQLIFIAFGLIFLVELPDKTFVAALVLSTRFKPLAVWVGVSCAFLVQCVVAVAAGQAVSFLPEWTVKGLSTAMFLIGAIVLLIAAPKADRTEREAEEEYEQKAGGDQRSWFRIALSCFLLIFVAEWGDLSQILTINLVAKYGSPVSAFIGSWCALLVVSGLAVVAGRVLLRYMKLSLLHYIAACVCMGFVGLGVFELVTGTTIGA